MRTSLPASITPFRSAIQSQNHSSRSGICEKKNLLQVSSASPNILNGNSIGHKPPTTAASILRRSNGGITRKPAVLRIMAPENPVIKSLSEQKKNPENLCCCGVFGILAIIPTRPCPIHPKQIRMGDVTHIIWNLFIIRSSPCPGRGVAIVLPRDREQRPTDESIIA